MNARRMKERVREVERAMDGNARPLSTGSSSESIRASTGQVLATLPYLTINDIIALKKDGYRGLQDIEERVLEVPEPAWEHVLDLVRAGIARIEPRALVPPAPKPKPKPAPKPAAKRAKKPPATKKGGTKRPAPSKKAKRKAAKKKAKPRPVKRKTTKKKTKKAPKRRRPKKAARRTAKKKAPKRKAKRKPPKGKAATKAKRKPAKKRR